MRAVVQRVTSAQVVVDGKVIGQCGKGFLVLAAAHKDDSLLNAEKLADRIAKMRVFSDSDGKMNLALSDLPPSDMSQVLAVSNFTLFGDASAGRRPSFTAAAPFEAGKEIFEHFVGALRGLGIQVETGLFGAHMDVSLENDGPVTLIVEG